MLKLFAMEEGRNDYILHVFTFLNVSKWCSFRCRNVTGVRGLKWEEYELIQKINKTKLNMLVNSRAKKKISGEVEIVGRLLDDI